METCGEILTSSGLNALHFTFSTMSIHSSLLSVAQSPCEYDEILRFPMCELSAAAGMHTDSLALD